MVDLTRFIYWASVRLVSSLLAFLQLTPGEKVEGQGWERGNSSEHSRFLWLIFTGWCLADGQERGGLTLGPRSPSFCVHPVWGHLKLFF